MIASEIRSGRVIDRSATGASERGGAEPCRSVGARKRRAVPRAPGKRERHEHAKAACPELASRLRLKFPGLKVIYMSGDTESALVQDGMLERNTVLPQKPFTVKKILEVIQQMNVSVRS